MPSHVTSGDDSIGWEVQLWKGKHRSSLFSLQGNQSRKGKPVVLHRWFGNSWHRKQHFASGEIAPPSSYWQEIMFLTQTRRPINIDMFCELIKEGKDTQNNRRNSVSLSSQKKLNLAPIFIMRFIMETIGSLQQMWRLKQMIPKNQPEYSWHGWYHGIKSTYQGPLWLTASCLWLTASWLGHAYVITST